jgi:hypothetical protein
MGSVKKFASDSNVMALEKGLDALLQFVEIAKAAPKYVTHKEANLVNSLLLAGLLVRFALFSCRNASPTRERKWRTGHKKFC